MEKRTGSPNIGMPAADQAGVQVSASVTPGVQWSPAQRPGNSGPVRRRRRCRSSIARSCVVSTNGAPAARRIGGLAMVSSSAPPHLGAPSKRHGEGAGTSAAPTGDHPVPWRGERTSSPRRDQPMLTQEDHPADADRRGPLARGVGPRPGLPLVPSGQSAPESTFMLTAYFAESGTDATSEVVTLAAYVSPVERWTRFTVEWVAVLRDPRFAVGEFKTGDWYGKYGEFHKFRDPKRLVNWRRLWAMLTRLIDKRVRFGVSVSIPVRQHEALTKRRLAAKSAFRDAYVLAMQACLEAIQQSEERRGERVACVFDDGHKHKGLAE